MNDVINTLVIVAWGKLNEGLITDNEYYAIHNALEALREQPEDITTCINATT